MAKASKPQDQLSYPPRGLRVARAAAYVGMSESLRLDAAFEALSEEEEKPRRNTVDEILGIDRDRSVNRARTARVAAVEIVVIFVVTFPVLDALPALLAFGG